MQKIDDEVSKLKEEFNLLESHVLKIIGDFIKTKPELMAEMVLVIKAEDPKELKELAILYNMIEDTNSAESDGIDKFKKLRLQLIRKKALLLNKCFKLYPDRFQIPLNVLLNALPDNIKDIYLDLNTSLNNLKSKMLFLP